MGAGGGSEEREPELRKETKRKLGAGNKRNPSRQGQKIKEKERFREHFEFLGGGVGGDGVVFKALDAQCEDLHLIPHV